MRVKLSDRFLRRSEGQQTDSFDSQTSGLALRVGAQAKSRPLHHWRNELTLGQYPAMSLANAAAGTLRNIAEAYLAQAANQDRLRNRGD